MAQTLGISGLALRSGQKQWYTLSFSYTFEYDDDTVFFACLHSGLFCQTNLPMCKQSHRATRYHYPYTYSHLCDFIDALEAHPYAGSLFSRRVSLGLTRAVCFLTRLTIVCNEMQ